jgi:hypothetical protein
MPLCLLSVGWSGSAVVSLTTLAEAAMIGGGGHLDES